MFAHFNSRFAGFAFIIHYSPNERLRTRTRSLGDHLGIDSYKAGIFRCSFNVQRFDGGSHKKRRDRRPIESGLPEHLRCAERFGQDWLRVVGQKAVWAELSWADAGAASTSPLLALHFTLCQWKGGRKRQRQLERRRKKQRAWAVSERLHFCTCVSSATLNASRRWNCGCLNARNPTESAKSKQTAKHLQVKPLSEKKPFTAALF